MDTSVISNALELISRDILLDRGAGDFVVRGNRQKPRQSGATTLTAPSGIPIHSRYRVNGLAAEQNDKLTIDGVSVLVWKVEPSPENSHQILTCVEYPVQTVELLTFTNTPDGRGGYTQTEDAPTQFDAYVYRDNRTISAEDQRHRTGAAVLMCTLPATVDVVVGSKLRHAGSVYAVATVMTRPDNAAWKVVQLGAS